MNVTAISLAGEEIPVKKILCVGRNYAAHAMEMGTAPPVEPILFFKPVTALARPAGGDLFVPGRFGELHHEGELVCLVGAGGKNLSSEAASRAVAGIAVGVDLTLRTIQATAKESRTPWAVAKGFDSSAPVGTFIEAGHGEIEGRRMTLGVNGSVRQEGNTSAMIFEPAKILSFASRYFTLERGDLLFTGTPPGVGPLVGGDRVLAAAEGLPELSFTVKR